MFFKKLFSKEMAYFVFTFLIIILIFTNLNTCNRLNIEKDARKQDKEIFNQNFEAFLDTMRVNYNEKLKAFEYDKKAFLTTLDELYKYDSTLSDKLDNIEGDIINAIDSKISIGTENDIEIDNELETYDDNNYGLKWDYNYNDHSFSQYLSGISRFKINGNKIFAGTTTIDSNYINLDISYGFREYDNRYQVWAVSASPRVKINELSGAYFINKPPPYSPNASYQNKWVFGPYIGYGINFNNKLTESRIGWGVGFSLQYNLFGFGKKIIKQKNDDKNYILKKMLK